MQRFQVFIFSIISLSFLLFNTEISTKNNIYENKYICNDTIVPDSIFFKLEKLKNNKEETIFYYGDIVMHPCTGDKCEIMNVRIYWDIFGNYYKYELRENNRLTKINHKEFSDKEYKKLHNIILDTITDFRYLELQDLTVKQAENSFFDTDAVSGATVKNRDFECINGAVKTSYQLWHIANGNTKSKILKFSENIKIDTSFFRKKTILDISNFNIIEFSCYLNFLDNNIPANKNLIKELSKLLLKNNTEISLLFYDFVIRNDIKKLKKYTKKYSEYISFKTTKKNTAKLKKEGHIIN